MRDRFLQQEVLERMGVDVKDALTLVLEDDTRAMFQGMLFSKIVPNCKKLGLLDAGDGWLRDRFTELGVIQFEDWIDTGRGVHHARRGRQGPRSRRVTLSTRRASARRWARRGRLAADVSSASARLG